MNKLLINCDELQALSGQNYHAVFDLLKKLITDPTISINMKYRDTLENYPDFCNLIMSTNNEWSIKIEQYDARYFGLNCSGRYQGNTAFFDNLVNNVFTQDVADHFFSYCYYYEPVDMTDIPETQLRKDMIMNSLSSPKRFLVRVKEMREGGEDKWDLENMMGGFDLYAYYKIFCAEENEKPLSATKFGREIKNSIRKIRSDGMKYELDTIDIWALYAL